MANTRIVKFKLRRGTNEQRVQIVPRIGELIYTTDIKRSFIGDGITLGGNPFSNINLVSTTFPTITAVGDIVYRSDLLRTYICTASGFTYTGPYPDTTSIEIYANKLQVVSASITKEKLYYYVAALSGGMSFNNTDGLGVSHDNTLYIAGNKLTPKSLGESITIDSSSHLSAGRLGLGDARLRSYTGVLTANGTFLVIKINNVYQGIRLLTPPTINIPTPTIPETYYITANDLSPIISDYGDNVIWF